MHWRLLLSIVCLLFINAHFLEFPPFPPFFVPPRQIAPKYITIDNTIENWSVLQQAPASAGIYGTSAFSAVVVEVDGDVKFTLHAVVKNNFWKVFIPPTTSGKEINITAKDKSSSVTVRNLIFGDVWFCSGQSNMALPIKNTLERNESIARISRGEFKNIRLKQIHTNMNPKFSWQTASEALANGNFSQFSGVCWYFAEALTLKLGKNAPPLGMIHTAIGGSTIGAWMKNSTTDTCINSTWDATNQQLWDSIVMPFSNYTLKGWLWYQGENNMFSQFGNSLTGVGYACLMVKLIEDWRKIWSTIPGTTSPVAPFGITTLTPSSDEGGYDIRSMGQAQTGGYGVVPNPAMPYTFLAQTFDLNDPWRNETCDACCDTSSPTPSSSSLMLTTAPTPRFCHGCDAYCDAKFATPWWFGPIHPRDKQAVGARLAQGALVSTYGQHSPITGPTLSGCTLLNNFLIIEFNQTLLGNDTILLKGYSKTTNASKLEVLVNVTEWCFQVFRQGNKTICIDDGFGNYPGNSINENTAWVPVDIDAASGNQIAVDLTKSRGVAFGVRYAFRKGGDCCTENPPTSGPCPLASCPLAAKGSGLPVNPFLAKIVKHKCLCMPPQVCDD